MIKGIDLSTYQKQVDYKKLKEEGIEFAIIRCGYGKDRSQKDVMFEEHYKGLKEAGIKVGCYLYSYVTSPENAMLEAENCLEFIKGKEFDLPIFYDLEDRMTRTLGKEAITECAINFCEKIKEAGYESGVYANIDWFTNCLNVYTLIEKGYRIWLAQWRVQEPTSFFPYDIWQFTNNLKVAGIKCDGNYCKNIFLFPNDTKELNIYSDTDSVKPNKKSNEEIADEVINGDWGNGQERKDKLTSSGYDASAIQEIVNSKLLPKKKTNTQIADEVIKGLWGNGQERKNKLAQAGYDYNAVQKIVNRKMSK